MIVTRSWLEEWIDLSGITTDELAKRFNAIGLEVDRVEQFRVPERIVVGKVLECEKHPDADKLNVCQVDVGSEVKQIVCGGANVRAGLTVAVAIEGAQMPGGLKIKPVKLRGVASDGMICSSGEIGQPKLEDGIMELDESIGELPLGSALSENLYLNDDLIELELTANRGDCLSIRGVARDLSAAFDRRLKVHSKQESEGNIGIGRILQLVHSESLDVDLRYHAIDLKELFIPVRLNLRLAQIEEQRLNDIESLLFYSTYSTGVVLNAYDHALFMDAEKKKAIVTLKQDSNGYAVIYSSEEASVVGVSQNKDTLVSNGEGMMLIEASYIPPDIISKQMNESKIDKDQVFYRTSRGSEPELNIGLQYCLGLFESNSDSTLFGGSVELCQSHEDHVISISTDEIDAFIGMKIAKMKVTQILRNLGFSLKKSSGQDIVAVVPRFRHDIVNRQDIVEEIVRMVGIDNIDSVPFSFTEENRLEDDYVNYKKRQQYRHRAAQSGFFESIHFIFDEREQLEANGFVTQPSSLELLNPIVNTLDTLRPTLLVGLLSAASQNAKMGQRRIPLFEIGSVFDAQRAENVHMAMLFSGDAESDRLENGGRPDSVSLDRFTKDVSDVIGDFTLEHATASHKLAHPYQCADIIVDGERIGELFRLHPTLQDSLDLSTTYLCELDFDKLAYGLHEASAFSKFQASFRDLSLLVPAQMEYKEIEAVIAAHKSSEVIRFYPVDRYQDESLEENISLTLRFVLQSMEKTLEEEDITSSVNGILHTLEAELGLTLR